jgi:hypothetical protein
MTSNLPFSSGIVLFVSPQAHLASVSTLSGPGISPYPAGYTGQPAEEPTMMSRFPVSFRPPAFASEAILRPLENRAFLAVGLP